MGGSIGSVSVSVVPSAVGFTSALRDQLLPEMNDLGEELGQALRDAMEEQLQGVTLTVDAQTEQAQADVDDLRANVDDLTAEPAVVDVGAETGEAAVSLDDLREKLDALEASHAELSVGVIDSEATAKLALLEAEIDALEMRHATLTVGMDTGGALSQAEDLSAAVDDLRTRMDAFGESAGLAGGDASTLAADLHNTAGMYDDVDAAISGTAGSLGGLGEKLAATDEQVAEFRSQFHLVADELHEFGTTTGAAGLDDMDSQMQSLARDLDEVSARGGTTADSLESMAQRLDGVSDSLNEAEARFGATGGAMGTMGGEAVTVAGDLHNSAGMYDQAAADIEQIGAAADKAGGDLSKLDSGGGGMGGGNPMMTGLLGMALALGPAFIAAAAGEALFFGAAIPDIRDLLHNTGAFRGDITAIKAEYMALAADVKPEVITDFDIALQQAKAILPEFAGAAEAGGRALGGFETQIGNLIQSGDTRQFLAFVSQAVGPDMHAFGNLITGGANAVEGFSESLNGISRTLINVAGGLLSFGGDVLRTAPWLGQWAVAVGGMYLAAVKIPQLFQAIVSSNFMTWAMGGTETLTAMAAAFTAAGGAEGVMAAGMAALDAVNPLVWAAGAVVAVGALGAVLLRTTPTVSGITQGLKEQYNATGYSVAGMQAYAKAMQLGASGSEQLKGALGGSFEEMHDGSSDTQALTIAQQQAATQSRNLTSNLDELQQMFGISRAQAIQLAVGAKVSASALEQSGSAGHAAMEKILAYAQAGAKGGSMSTQLAADFATAASGAAGMASRVSALTTALNLETTASLGAIGNAVGYHQAMQTLAKDEQASGDKAGYMTAKQQATALQLVQTTQAAEKYSATILQATGSVSKAEGPLEAMLTNLEKLKDPTAAEKQLIDELRKSIDQLKSKQIQIGVHVLETTSSYSAAQAAAGEKVTVPRNMVTPRGMAGGGRIPGFGGGDIHPAFLESGETIVSKEHSQLSYMRAAFTAAGVPGYAAGGMPGGTWSLRGWGGPDEFDVFLDILNSASPYDVSRAGVNTADRLAQEFASGTLRTVTQIRDAGKQAIKALQDYYTGPDRSVLEGVLRNQTTALEKLAGSSQKISSEIAGMRAAEKAEISSLQSYASLGNITGGTSASGATLPPSGSQIVAGLHADLAQLHRFFNVLKRLQKMKLDKAMLQQVIALGPVSGTQYGQAIIDGGEKIIGEINKDEQGISGAEKKVGQAAADIQYGQNISRGFLSGLEKEKDKLDKEMKDLGDKIARELEDALHGKLVVTASGGKAAGGGSYGPSGSGSVGGTSGTSGGLGKSQASDIVASLRRIDARELNLATKEQMNTVISLLRQEPKAVGTAAGTAMADALNKVTSAAAAKARARVRG